MEASAVEAQPEGKVLSPLMRRRAGERSFACTFDRCGECDALVHFEPVGMNGTDMSGVPEMERPHDLRPRRCDCECHREAVG